MSWINGRKTYIIAGLTIAFALASWWGGTMSYDQAVALALGGAGLGALRNALPPKA